MGKVNRVIREVGVNKKIWLSLFLQKYGEFIPDNIYLKWIFYLRMGYRLNLKDPLSFSEKLQWLKLYDRNPVYSKLVDKCEVKKYINEKLGPSYIISTIAVWDSLDQINLKSLPDRFVLKTTQGGGGYGVVICKGKKNFDVEKAMINLKKSINKSIYKEYREWPYKNIKPRIIAEEFMEQEDGTTLVDYKFFCFNGQPKFLYVRQPGESSDLNFITMDWKPASFRRVDAKPSEQLPSKPALFGEMVDIATKLSSEFPFVRVDLYVIGGKIYFSELTFYPSSGLLPFVPQEWDFKLGELLLLPKRKGE